MAKPSTLWGRFAAVSYLVLASAANIPTSAALAEGAGSAFEMMAVAESNGRASTMLEPAPAVSTQSRSHGRSAVVQARSGTPTIASLSPTSGRVGTLVTILGANFTSNNVIQFRSAQTAFAAGSPVSSESGTSLQFQVSTCPSYEPQCPGFHIPPGVYNVTVNNANWASNEATFVVTSR
jgi:hypothetical protein